MPCSGARVPRSLGTHPPKKVPTFADYLVFGGAAVDGAPGTFPARRLPPRLQTPNSRQKLALFWGGGCRATAAPARRSMASAEIARINGLDILASDLRRV